MELSQIFSGLVALECALHLADRVGQMVFTSSTGSMLDDTARRSQQRSDWYCYFFRSALTGSGCTINKVGTGPVRQPQATHGRQSNRQPRASVSA